MREAQMPACYLSPPSLCPSDHSIRWGAGLREAQMLACYLSPSSPCPPGWSVGRGVGVREAQILACYLSYMSAVLQCPTCSRNGSGSCVVLLSLDCAPTGVWVIRACPLCCGPTIITLASFVG